jgi:hypothetical protein
LESLIILLPSIWMVKQACNDTFPQVRVVPDIEYLLVLNFKNIPDQITKTQLLEITLQNRKSVQFRNISFSN